LKYIFKYFFVGILILAFFQKALAQGIGPNKVYYLVHDCHDDWHVYDERYKSYVPYIKDRHADYASFSLFFDVENYKNYKLIYKSSKENFLFIDSQLQRQLPTDQFVVLDIDSLQAVYSKTQLFLTIYGPNTALDDIELKVGNRIAANFSEVSLGGDDFSLMPKQWSPFQNFLILGFLFLLSCYAFLYSYQKRAFERYFSFNDLVSINIRDDSFLVNKPFDIGNLFFVFNLSFVVGYLFMIIQNFRGDIFTLSGFLGDNQNLSQNIYNYFKVSLVVFALFMGKYFSLSALSNLYQLRRITNVHFFKIIQSSGIFFLILALVLLYIRVNYPTTLVSLEKWIFGFVIGFFVLRMVLLYLTINKLATLKNLYLFSYLCIVEFIPLLVGVRFALP
jgi:hypothetical protein